MVNRVAYWRRERGLTQEVLSMAAEMPRHRLGLIERQLVDMTERELEILARILKVPKNRLQSKGAADKQTEFLIDEEA